jgi:glucose-1-phosphate adenylyltransferase
MMNDVLSLILGGGRGSRLFPLTMLRSKPAVPIAGKYRLIDIPISNCINSGCNRIYILTQFLSVSLHRHIGNTYKFDPFSRGFVEVLAAQQTNEAADWYQGTADAVRQNIRYVHEDKCRDVLILSGDQLYRMDFRKLLQTHHETGADVTIAVLPVNADNAAGFGICRLDDKGKVVGFLEKPQTAEQLAPLKTTDEWIAARGIQAQGRNYLASMGIYLFKREALFHLLNAPPLATDFGKEIFPRSIHTHHVQAHLFDGYWEDVGTVKSYHEANLALTSDKPPFVFYHEGGLIYTRMRYLPASRVNAARLDHCLVSDGCVIGAGTTITRCVIGIRTQIGRNVTLRNSVVLGADRYDNQEEREENQRRSLPSLGIGDGSVIDNAILDKDSRIGVNCRIINKDRIQNSEGKNFVIRDGVVVIPKGAVVLDGTVI